MNGTFVLTVLMSTWCFCYVYNKTVIEPQSKKIIEQINFSIFDKCFIEEAAHSFQKRYKKKAFLNEEFYNFCVVYKEGYLHNRES